MEHLRRDLLLSLRRLRVTPAFTAFAVITLALGIGATTAIYSVIYTAVLRPPDLKDVDRVMNLYHADPRTSAGAPRGFPSPNRTTKTCAGRRRASAECLPGAGFGSR